VAVAVQETLFSNISADRGVHEYIAEAISACDQTDRPELYANIVIAGGSTCFAGFEARLEAELREYVAANVSSQAARQCHVVWKRNRKYSAWQGASLMQSMAGFWENEDVVSSILEDDELDDGEEGSDSDESESSRASMDDHSSDGEGAV
jgi:hypothetical protein